MRIGKRLLSLMLAAALTVGMTSMAFAASGPVHKVSFIGLHTPNGTAFSRTPKEDMLTLEELEAYVATVGEGWDADSLINNCYSINMKVGETLKLHHTQGNFSPSDPDQTIYGIYYTGNGGKMTLVEGAPKPSGIDGQVSTYCSDVEITAKKAGEIYLLVPFFNITEIQMYKLTIGDDLGRANLSDLSYSIDGGEATPVPGFKYNETDYDVVLPLGVSSLPLGFSSITLNATPEAEGAELELTAATPDNMRASATVTSLDGKHSNTYDVNFHQNGWIPDDGGDDGDDGDDDDDGDITIPGGNDDGGSSGGSGTASTPSNTVNAPETGGKLKETAAALKELGGGLTNAIAQGKFPAGVTLEKAAGGAAIAAVPVKMSVDSAITMEMMGILGGIGKGVGIKAAIGKDAELLLPGGFGKITEPGRLYFPMTYRADCDSQSDMLKAVKGENVKSDTVQLGASLTLPTQATLTLKTSVPHGQTVKIYCYDKAARKLTLIGSAKVVQGRVKFDTKQLGEFLFTTGTV